MDKLRFFSLASGSSGNCYFVGNANHGILFDAGIGIRAIKKKLKEYGYGFENILAVFITHDHFDHIKSVGILGEKYHLPIYSTEKILDGINKCYAVTEKLYNCKKPILKNAKISLAEFNITAFQVSHDSTECLGYTLEYKNSRFTLATDLGYICEESASHFIQANYLIIEANFDMQMLENSRYPAFLRNRIHGEKGHLCNDETATFLARNYQKHLQYIYLCHLSKNNNTPERAFDTVKKALEDKNIIVGKDVQLTVLPRTASSEIYIFD
ncbi:MBL fold metallo-hydrolase [Bacteroidales bacterium OttesenSCG-928-I21]|nr:MBL fold metallo-hydrolase [Bacteroidales bacterium OttesenSCG-928-I21]